MATPIRNLGRLLNGARSVVGLRAIRYGVLPTLEPQRILRRLQPKLVIDVGANRGQFALDVLATVPSAVLLSFEPLESEFQVLQQILGPVDHAHLWNQGLGPRAGRAVIHVSRAADSSSLLPISAKQAAYFPGTEEVREEDVEIRTLADVLVSADASSIYRDPSLLKADVQGYELEVLRGAGQSLGRFSWIYLELSFVELYRDQPLAGDVVRYLDEYGFSLADMGRPAVVDGRAVQVDALFERR